MAGRESWSCPIHPRLLEIPRVPHSGPRAANTPYFANFLGFLDGNGRAVAEFSTLGPLSAAAGIEVHFAMITAQPFGFASNPITVCFTP
ncbi:MAG: hypothetical protein H6825_10440 [Planctomycetes bacterium]|nr:hypothetical protein [Planctomycetota bacterium]